ncbi:hypothetical protein BJ944DRAFT_269873 [Cunninghamella echinulata]|nr:hypothetical protein BJ944DRAFT_269873 [Cunninghamella echinulata]
MSNESSKSTQDQNGNPYELLGSALNGIQSSYSSVYSTLHRTLERSVQMTQTMQQVLTHMFKTQVKIGTKLEYHEGVTQLIITINNTTSFPIVGLTCQLLFKPIHKETDLPTIKWISSKHIKLDQSSSPSQSEVNSLFVLNPSLTSSSTSNILYPNTKHIEILHLQTPTMPTQYNGTIDIQIPIPCATTNDSSSLEISQSFGLYIIDQLKKTVINDNSESALLHHVKQVEEKKEEYNFPVQFFRDIMKIHPVLGIHKNMHLCLEPTSESLKDEQIICQVNTVLLEDNLVKVKFYGKNKTLIDALVHELNMLKNL